MKAIKKTKKRYQLGRGSLGSTREGARLRRVYHVSHLQAAQRILEDGKISARRVDDDSCLDAHRVSVTWMAPNRWGEKGSRYGTVEFAFDFATLVEGRKIYWVEGVDDRSLETCRLLISNNDVSHLPVRLYDPETSIGPLRHQAGEWTWKSDLEFELMVEGDVSMSQCVGIEAIKHSRDYCGRGSAYRCDEVNREELETTGRLLAGALAGRYRLPPVGLVEDGRISPFLQQGWFNVTDELDAQFDDIDGKIRDKQSIDLLLTAALTRLADGDRGGAMNMASLVASAKRLRSSLKRLLLRRLKVSVTSQDGGNISLSGRAASQQASPETSTHA